MPPATSSAVAEQAGQICSRLLDTTYERRRNSRRHRSRSLPQPPKAKEYIRNLIVIDFQCQESNQECTLHEYQKIFDGLIQITSDQSENDIRQEIVRLVQLKDINTHHLELLTTKSFSFVKVGIAIYTSVGISLILRFRLLIEKCGQWMVTSPVMERESRTFIKVEVYMFV